jgi:hypothetical protein
MSLGVVIKGPEGVVLAADSRVTLGARQPDGTPLLVNFDNATKLLTFSGSHQYVGAVTYGAAVIGLRTAHSFIPEFEVSLGSGKRLAVKDFTERLQKFFAEQWAESMPKDFAGPKMTFIVGGYDEKEPYGTVYLFEVPGDLAPQERSPGMEFGMTWGGQLEVASRLIRGHDPLVFSLVGQHLNLSAEQIQALERAIAPKVEFRIPYPLLPLQDCIDLATFLVRTTITAQTLGVSLRGVGGPIDVAYITRTKGLQFVQQKTLRGEAAFGTSSAPSGPRG